MNNDQFLKDLGIGHPKKGITADDVGAFLTVVATIGFVVMLLSILTGCSVTTSVKPTYTARACNRDGCIVLSTFKDDWECREFTKALKKLHELRKDRPTRILGCQED